jgi:F-type H+-transporting ATPase subunit alpha
MFIEKDILTYGVVISVGSGVVTLQGFLMAFVGEIFRVCSSGSTNSSFTTFGLVVNLSRDDTMNLLIGALLLHPENRLGEGSSVQSMSRLASLMLGDFAIGSILDPVGNLIFNSDRIDVQCPWIIEAPATGIIDRHSVSEALQTGVISIDSMVPVGGGQRELVVGDRQTGKTSICVDAILNQKYASLFCVYVSNGQSASSISSIFLALTSKDAIFYVSIVAAAASESAVCQFLCAYTGSTLSEFFVITGELPSLLILDDLSRHAVAYREIYLLLRRPPGREGYPGEIFFVHSRLLERSAKLSYNLGGASLTCFPIIETLAGDVSAYITTNVISITDGQIALSAELAVSGIKPAIDVGLSVTRVGSAAQWYGMKLVAGSLKLELAQFVELQSFSQFAADLGEETKNRLARGRSLVEILKQFCGSPMNLMAQVGILSLANQGLIGTLAIEDIRKFLDLYLHLPAWVFLFVPPIQVGKSLVRQLL